MATFPDSQPQEVAKIPCLKCRRPTSLDEGAVVKGRGQQLQCKACWNLYQILYRHVGGIPETLNHLEPKQQAEFFKSTGDLMLATPKNGRWALVRKSIVTSVASFKTEQVHNTVEKKYRPLSVWKQKGYDVKDIEERGESRDDDVTRLWGLPSRLFRV